MKFGLQQRYLDRQAVPIAKQVASCSSQTGPGRATPERLAVNHRGIRMRCGNQGRNGAAAGLQNAVKGVARPGPPFTHGNQVSGQGRGDENGLPRQWFFDMSCPNGERS